MSDYIHNKSIMYPIDDIAEELCAKYNIEEHTDLYWKVPELKPLFNNGFELEYFYDYDNDKLSHYLAYNLYSTYGKESGDFGRSRFLSSAEQEKYKKIFEQIIPEVNPSKLKYVDYCWYNCSECEDYYIGNDDFNKEI